MGYFQVRYDSRVVNYNRRGFIRLATDPNNPLAKITSVTSKLFVQWLCSSVGRAVPSDSRGPRFKSSDRQKFIYIEHLFTVNCVLKRRK